MDSDLIHLIPLGLGWFSVFLFSTTFHEAAHSLVSYKLGDPTAFQGGQVSLNPLPHIRREPFGMVLVPLLTFFLNHGNFMFGWASAPYDPAWAREHPRRSALMALAGPMANLILVFISGTIIHVGLMMHWFQPLSEKSIYVMAVNSPALTGVAMLLSLFFLLNVILFCFNLLPIPPLDGSSALALFLPVRYALNYRDFMSQPSFSLIGLIVAWNVAPPIIERALDGFLWLVYRGVY